MKRQTSTRARPALDYSAELAELERLLALEKVPQWADFYYAEFWVCEDEVAIAELSSKKSLQRQIRAVARQDESCDYNAEGDTVRLEGRELACEIWVPFGALCAIQQARYRMILLMAGHPPLEEAFGRLDEWVHLDDRHMAWANWGREGVRYGEYENDVLGSDNGELIAWLVEHKIDLARWASAYEVDTYLELPITPAMAWVQQQRVAGRLFGLLEEDLRHDDLDEHGLQRLIAYALHALRVVGERSEELRSVEAINAAARDFDPRLRLTPAVYASQADGSTTTVTRARRKHGTLEVQRAPRQPWLVAELVWRVRVSESDFPGPHRAGKSDDDGEGE